MTGKALGEGPEAPVEIDVIDDEGAASSSINYSSGPSLR
jgi:hypothetical protein